ncbi:MAG TPA: helix-turn-helix domain-containing protein [Sandaracinaceae bacterium LLY-WYZ-13_1]|nr:helix-turn-helix domain-containing protein [Sandaracinaceae bacterium LLY-WYZ-13_1]
MRASTRARRRAILEGALDCYADLGWTATTIADLRERSGASTGSIYHHFGDKEGVAAALYAEVLRRYREPLLAQMARRRTARSVIRGIVIHHLEWAAAHPVWARFLVEMRGTDAVQRSEAALREGTTDLVRHLFARLAPHLQRGAIVALPEPLFVPVILGPAQDVVRHWVRGRLDLDPSDVAAPLADAAWRR